MEGKKYTEPSLYLQKEIGWPHLRKKEERQYTGLEKEKRLAQASANA